MPTDGQHGQTAEFTALDTHAESQAGGIAALGVNAPVLITQIANFLILFLVLRWLLYRPITDMLERRRTAIAEGIAAAERAERELASAAADAAETRAVAKQEARQLVDQARVTAEQVGAGIVAKAEAQAARLIEQAERRAEQEIVAAKAGLERELGSLVVTAAGKLAGNADIAFAAADAEQALREAGR